ncbi:hypothetical protein HZA96_02070 [Candidatus Woesearchaeota archaeon]|nr:hypothetical protein [Candidatus Woesearchaeota archaeon]
MNIICIKQGCFLCDNDIYGNEELHYFCKFCNMFYRKVTLEGKKIRYF